MVVTVYALRNTQSEGFSCALTCWKAVSTAAVRVAVSVKVRWGMASCLACGHGGGDTGAGTATLNPNPTCQVGHAKGLAPALGTAPTKRRAQACWRCRK